MAHTLVLSASPRIRYFTGALLYFAQGIPQGLLAIALPAWLASLGVGAGAIGSYLAVIVLPWAFKLVTGPFMDRFQFLPMGLRRPWVLSAQFGLMLAFLAFSLVDNPAEQVGLLMVIGALINSFAATQDVAVDGMAIDLTPVNEQGRLNAFMGFGKAIGWSLSAAVSGYLLVEFGLQVTAIVAAIISGVIFFSALGILEREGERILPWSKGKAQVGGAGGSTFRAVFEGISTVLWTRASMVVMAIMFFDGLISGYGHALMPLAAIYLFGFDTKEWSQLVAIMSLVGACLALAFGPLIDRFGAKRMLFLTATLVGIHALLLAQTQDLWEDTTYVRVMLSVWITLTPVVLVCVIALAMAVCKSRHSATQFAIYMSIANLGYSAGSKTFGMLADRASYDTTYLVMALLAGALVIVLFFHHQRHEVLEQVQSKAARGHGMHLGGTRGGLFWSGAMRCPKCRSDMETVLIDDIEVDRCEYCHGLWFDDGELQALNNPFAASVLDTGDVKAGREYNFMDDYRCPRCGDEMARKSDPQQPHIWYEQCTACAGTFFDAGEFKDLARHTLSDFFKWMVTPDRK
jgi:PAT family beta-lactamase induction signal transducer AmpG